MSEFNGEKLPEFQRKVFDEFEAVPATDAMQSGGSDGRNGINIIEQAKDFVDNKVAEKRADLLANNEEINQQATEIAKDSLSASFDEQQANIRKQQVDTAKLEHEIQIEKHKLDIAAKYDFKITERQKKAELHAKKKEILNTKHAKLKNEHNIKSNNGIVLFIISFFVELGEFFKGISKAFSGFNVLLKSIIFIGIIALAWWIFDFTAILQKLVGAG